MLYGQVFRKILDVSYMFQGSLTASHSIGGFIFYLAANKMSV